MRSLKEKLPIRFLEILPDTPIEEVRFRIGRPMEAKSAGKCRFIGGALTEEDFSEVLGALSGHSLYAFEEEMKRGFFTLEDGCRVGITGRFSAKGDEVLTLAHAQALCVRIAREVKGCADGLMRALFHGGVVRSMLIVSPPGMGKTTMLRDAARQLSERGVHVAISDERGEIAGAHMGRPTLDIGPMSDVADGLIKRVAIPQLLRTMSPDVIVTDELGAPGDAEAVDDALRSGVAVVASAHGASVSELIERPLLRPLLTRRTFASVAVLGERPGNVLGIHALKENDYESVGAKTGSGGGDFAVRHADGAAHCTDPRAPGAGTFVL